MSATCSSVLTALEVVQSVLILSELFTNSFFFGFLSCLFHTCQSSGYPIHRTIHRACARCSRWAWTCSSFVWTLSIVIKFVATQSPGLVMYTTNYSFEAWFSLPMWYEQLWAWHRRHLQVVCLWRICLCGRWMRLAPRQLPGWWRWLDQIHWSWSEDGWSWSQLTCLLWCCLWF